MSTTPNASATVETPAAQPAVETTPSSQESVESTSQATTPESTETPSEQVDAAAAEATTSDTDHLGYDQLLPWEQLDSYPDELLTLAARKFGIDQKIVPSIRTLLKSKIDADIYSRNLEAQLPQEEQGGEEYEMEGSEATTGQPVGAPEGLTDSYRAAMDAANSLVTDDGAALYIKSLQDVQTKLQAAYETGDPDAIKAASKEALATQYGLFLMGIKEVLPRVLPEYLSKTVETEQKRISTYREARERLAKDTRYGDVDQLYSGKVFQQILNEVPGLAEMRFKDARTGRLYTLDSVDNAMAQYRYAIHLYRGARVGSPTQLVKQAAQKGKEQAAEERNRNDLGKLNAGGRSTGKVGGQEEDWLGKMISVDKARNPMTNLPRANAFKKS